MNNLTLAVAPNSQIPYTAEFYLTLRVLAHAWPAIILFGLVANTVNIVVFLKTGVKDSVTILLLGLAVSDLMFLTLISPTVCGYTIQAFVRPNPWPFDFKILFFLLYWPAYTVYDLSSFISLSLGLMRCACVTFPLKFKSIFTKSRTANWLVFFFILAVCLRVPMLSVYRLTLRKDPSSNSSELYLLAVNNDQMTRINDVMNRGVITYLAFITMVICVIVLSFKLYESSKIRQSSTTKVVTDSQSTTGKSNTKRLSAKDLQVIQSVTLVCTIFIFSQLTLVALSVIRGINPEIDNGERLVRLFGLIAQVAVTSAYLNASVNIFVYYKYNSKYRSAFKSLIYGERIK